MGAIDKIKEMVGAKKAPDSFKAGSEESKQRVGTLWAKDSEARKPMEQQWQLHLSMVAGNQWCGWNGTSVQPLQAPSWRIQSVDNKLFVRTRSKMTNLLTDSTPQFLPESAEHIDLRRSRYKERILHHVLREIGANLIKARAAQWVAVCGEAYTEVYWNDTAGDTYADEAGAFSEGEVGIRVRGPFEAWPAAGASAGNNGGRLWTADTVPVELARLKYNNKEISPDASELSDMQLRANMDSFFQSGSVQSSSNSRKHLEECVMVKTLREYRTKTLPNGRITTVINGKVIDESDLLWCGLTHIINFPSFSSYHGDAVELRLSIQPQKSINRLESNWEEYVRVMARGKILLHGGTKIKFSQFDNEHGEVIESSGAGPPPTAFMPPPMPSDTKELIQLRTQTIDDLYSDHMASQGKAPASASGAAINYLIESDQQQHTLTRDLWNDGLARTYEKIIDVVAGKSGKGGYKEGRMVAILGENRRADVTPVDLTLLEGKNRCEIVIGGALPANKTLRAEVIRRWYTDGMLGDPAKDETRRKAMKMTDAGILEEVENNDALDEIRAEKENIRLAAGEMVAPRPEDNHLVHVWTHEHHMKTDDFLLSDVEVQDKFYDHIEIHKKEMVNPGALLALLQSKGKMPPPPAAPIPGGPPAPGLPPTNNSSAMQGPGDMLKSVTQAGEPPPAAGIG